MDFSSESVLNFVRSQIPLLKDLALALVILFAGWIVSKWVDKLANKAFRARNLDEALGRFIGSILRYATLAAALIASLGTVGIETTSLVAILASAGLAIGLALQGSLSNFASGVMILFFRPFNLGDRITAGGHTGVVKDIGIFTTTLNTPSNERIIIPNSSVTSDAITNYTVEGTLRGTISVGVAYGADTAQVIAILKKAAQSADLVLTDPEPAIAFVGLGASSLDFNVMAWSKTTDFLGMMHNVRNAVYNQLNEAGIEIPFNQIVVHKAES